MALGRVDTVKLTDRPRMLDWARWVTAAETRLGLERGQFLKAYVANRGVAREDAVESTVIGPALLAVLTARDEWDGTLSDLLVALTKEAGDAAKKQKTWPANSRGLRAALDRVARALRAVGWSLDYSPYRPRRVHIYSSSSNSPRSCNGPSQPSRPSTSGSDSDSAVTESDGPEDRPDSGPSDNDSRKSAENGVWDGRDGFDGRLQPCEDDGEEEVPAATSTPADRDLASSPPQPDEEFLI